MKGHFIIDTMYIGVGRPNLDISLIETPTQTAHMLTR